MIRAKGEAGTGNVVEAVRHVRSVMAEIRSLRNMDDDEVLVVIVYSFLLFWLFGPA
jgi:pyridoxal biosynthesis lyase PdxS